MNNIVILQNEKGHREWVELSNSYHNEFLRGKGVGEWLLYSTSHLKKCKEEFWQILAIVEATTHKDELKPRVDLKAHREKRLAEARARKIANGEI